MNTNLAPTRQARWAPAFLLLWLFIPAGCFEGLIPGSLPVTCRDGGDCPTGLACLASGAVGRCVAPGAPCVVVDGDAATPLADGTPCGDASICVATACVAPRCGDGVVSAPETCDGSGGCRPTCTSCGDGVLDDGEACDNGAQNSDVQPGACRATCTVPVCGDGVRDPGEACDEGDLNSDVEADACRSTCARATCGDGAIDDGEDCDDGVGNSASAADACRPTCVAPGCGDGVVDDGEACDDGALNSDVRRNACRTSCDQPRCGDSVIDDGEGCDGGADCRADCSRCGDGVLDEGEACDNGAQNSDVEPGACRASCTLPGCGDAVRDPGEGCDDGAANSDVDPDACRSICARATCGDGAIDDGEDCDDGVLNSASTADACRPTCVAPACGDGVVDEGEVCDDGGLNSDVRRNACRTSCALPRCGDGVVDDGEGCDGGADCRADCSRCGDGVLDAGEACDTGGQNSDIAAGACRTSCRLPACGDGVADPGEACDEGAQNSDVVADACRSDCVRASCGDDVVDRGEACDDGDTASGDGCRGDCGRIERCGDLVVDSGEACDDGNDNPRDGCEACRLQVWSQVLVVSGTVEGREAFSSPLNSPRDVATDALGRLVIAEFGGHRVRRVELDGTMITIAGTGQVGADGDGGPATSATIAFPASVAVDTLGRVLVADPFNFSGRIRRIELDGTITTVAGTGAQGSTGDGGPATSAQIVVEDVIVDRLGRVVFVGGGRIRRIDGRGIITTVATVSGVGALGVDEQNRLLLIGLATIRRLEPDGTVTLMAGNGTLGFSPDGTPAVTAAINQPKSAVVDPQGRLVFTEQGNARVRRIEADGTLRTIAGIGFINSSAGDGGPATEAAFLFPEAVTVDADGRIVVVDSAAHRVRRIGRDGIIKTVAGNGVPGFVGDGSSALSAPLGPPQDVAIDAAGRVIVADPDRHVVRRIEPDGTASIIAGTGVEGSDGDGGPATRAQLSRPFALEFDGEGRLVIAEVGVGRLRRLEPDGTLITLITGISFPEDLAIDSLGRIVIVQPPGLIVSRLDPDGTLVHLAGTGGEGSDGDGGPAVDATFFFPQGIAVDGEDRVVIADTGNGRIRRIEEDGTIVTVADGLSQPRHIGFDAGGNLLVVTGNELRGAPVGVGGGRGDGGPASAASLNRPNGFVFDGSGRIVVADGGDVAVRLIEPGGAITTIAGAVHPIGPGENGVAQLYPTRALTVLDDTIVSVGAFGRAVGVDLGARVVSVVVGYEPGFASPLVADRAGFAPLLEDARGVAFDPIELTLLITQQASGAIRRIGLDQDNDRIVDDPGLWTSTDLATELDGPAGIGYDPAADTFLVVDEPRHCVARLDRSGAILETVLGRCGALGSSAGLLNDPTHVAVSPGGSIYVADTGNHRVMRFANGVTSVVIGDGSVSSAGEGAPARLFPVNAPRQLALDDDGNLYIASTTTIRLVANVDGDDEADGDDRVFTIFGGGARTGYPESVASCLHTVAVSDDGRVFAADACQGFMVELLAVQAP